MVSQCFCISWQLWNAVDEHVFTTLLSYSQEDHLWSTTAGISAADPSTEQSGFTTRPARPDAHTNDRVFMADAHIDHQTIQVCATHF